MRAAVPAFAVRQLLASCAFAVWHGALGAVHHSAWFAAMCGFYLILALVRLCAVLSGGRGVFAPRFTGVMLFALGAAVACVNTISLSQGIAAAYGTIAMISIAAFTTGKVTSAAVCAVRQRGKGPLFAALNRIRCAEAAASVLTLQRSMLVSFGPMPADTGRMMNALTGAGVCLFLLILGIASIRDSKKETILWQSQNW